MVLHAGFAPITLRRPRLVNPDVEIDPANFTGTNFIEGKRKPGPSRAPAL